MWCTFNEQNMSKKECDTAWDYEMHLLYNIFQTESNVMVDSGKIIEYITKHFLPTPTLQMHFTSLNKPVHLTKKLNKSKCTSGDSRWFLLNTTKCTCYCLIQPRPPQLQLHENLLKRKINLHVQAKALISFAMHDWFLVVSYLML